MSDFLYLDIAGALRDAKDCLQGARTDIEDVVFDGGNEGQAERLGQWLTNDHEIATLYRRLQELQAEIAALWTPELKARLKDEQDEQARREELADASSY